MIPNYSSRESREQSVRDLLTDAANERENVRLRWDQITDYYEGRHHTQMEIAEACREAGIPWIAAASPDVYLHVESQIVSDLPDFIFRGRDEDLDDERAEQRAFVVRYILDRTRLADLIPLHERRCILCGTAVWKVFWDGSDIRVDSIDPRSIYPDPAASSIDDCEFISYVYRISRRAAARIYADDLRAAGLDPMTLRDDDSIPFADPAVPSDDSTLRVTEHWFRDDDGRIACSILLAGHEVRFIPDYWPSTGCAIFPFVFQHRVSDGDFWGRSDLEPIIPLVDAVDRELAAAQLQSTFTGSDIILAEQDAFSAPPEQRPGAIWELKPGAIDTVKRLGGLGEPENRLAMIDALRSMIQDAVGNYDVTLGKEPARVLSATGLAQLLERADQRKASKKAQRLRAYERLYHLLDWSALEFYTAPRVLRLDPPASSDSHGPVIFRFDPSAFRARHGYFPVVDCEVSAADALETSRAFTLSALETLMSHAITRENYPLTLAAVRALDLEESDELQKHFETVFSDSQSVSDVPAEA